MAQVNGGLIIGKTANTEALLDAANPHGIITPRTENFVIQNTKFFNFDWNDAAALGTCSHCFHPAATDSGARTITLNNLSYDTTVAKRIKYQYPFKAIFYDLDGSTTNKGPNTWATFDYPHHMQPECTLDKAVFDGVTCDSTVQVRRLAFHAATPGSLFSGMALKILKWDDSLFANMDDTQKQAHLDDRSNYSTIIFKPKLDPSNGWATPFVTNHKYKFHFGLTGLNFEKLRIDMSERWKNTDHPIYLSHNFSDVRAAIDVIVDGGNKTENNTIAANEADWVTGQNLVINITDLNSTEPQYLHTVFNGKDVTEGVEKKVQFVGHRCIENCQEQITA